MNQREDNAEAKTIKERLHEEAERAGQKLHPSEQIRQRANQPFSRYSEGPERVDPKTGWKWHTLNPSTSSSSSWWQSSENFVAGIELE